MALHSTCTSADVAGKSTDSCKQTKSRNKRWEEWETIALANFVKDNARELFGSSGGAAVEHVKRKAWLECELKLKAAGGPDRGGWEVIRKKWADVSYRAKVYSRKIQGRNVTGGGKQPEKNLAMEAVLNALPDEVTQGIVPMGVCETKPKVNTTPAPVNSDPPAQDNTAPPPPDTTDTESESQSQESQTSGVHQPKGKRKRQGKQTKPNKQHKQNKEVELLELNREILAFEKEKMKHQEEKISLQREMVNVLRDINVNIAKLIPSPFQIILDPEQ